MTTRNITQRPECHTCGRAATCTVDSSTATLGVMDMARNEIVRLIDDIDGSEAIDM